MGASGGIQSAVITVADAMSSLIMAGEVKKKLSKHGTGGLVHKNIDDIFNQSGKRALIVGYQGNLGPVWMHTLNEMGADTFVIGMPETDVRQIHQLEREKHKDPDIIVYNAAIDNPPSSDGDGTDPFRNYEGIKAVNEHGLINVLRVFLPGMVKKGGVIVGVGSIMGYGAADSANYDNGWIKPFAYNASKAAMRQIAKSVTEFYGKYNVRMVVPSFGPCDFGQLPQEFKDRFMPKVPLGRGVTEASLKATLAYAVACPELAGDWLVDAGYRMKTA